MSNLTTPVHVFEEVVEVRGTRGQYHFVSPERPHLVSHGQPNIAEIGVVSKVTKSKTEKIYNFTFIFG